MMDLGRKKKVLARSYGGRPLERIELGRDLDVAFLCDPLALGRVAQGESYPIGFPLEDVFAFDEALYAEIGTAHAAGRGDRVRTLWENAKHEGE